MTTSVTFRPSEADLVAGYRLQVFDSFRRPRALVRFLIVTLICASATAWLFGDEAGITVAAAMGAIYWWGLVALCVAIGMLLLPRRVRRIYAQQKSFHDDTTVEWSDEAISFRSPRGTTTYSWSDFLRIVDGRDIILLMQSDALFNFVPKRALTSKQAADFVRQSRAKGSGGATAVDDEAILA